MGRAFRAALGPPGPRNQTLRPDRGGPLPGGRHRCHPLLPPASPVPDPQVLCVLPARGPAEVSRGPGLRGGWSWWEAKGGAGLRAGAGLGSLVSSHKGTGNGLARGRGGRKLGGASVKGQAHPGVWPQQSLPDPAGRGREQAAPLPRGPPVTRKLPAGVPSRAPGEPRALPRLSTPSASLAVRTPWSTLRSL